MSDDAYFETGAGLGFGRLVFEISSSIKKFDSSKYILVAHN